MLVVDNQDRAFEANVAGIRHHHPTGRKGLFDVVAGRFG